MRCRYCDAPARVLSTREPAGEFYVVRRLSCTVEPRRHRFNTVEVLDSFINKIAGKQVKFLLELNRRGAARMRVASARRDGVREGLIAGKKYEAIAAELGVSLATVRKYAKEARDGTPAPMGRPPNKTKAEAWHTILTSTSKTTAPSSPRQEASTPTSALSSAG